MCVSLCGRGSVCGCVSECGCVSLFEEGVLVGVVCICVWECVCLFGSCLCVDVFLCVGRDVSLEGSVGVGISPEGHVCMGVFLWVYVSVFGICVTCGGGWSECLSVCVSVCRSACLGLCVFTVGWMYRAFTTV